MEQKETKTSPALEAVSPDTGLTALQERGAILLASGARLTDVAKEMNISRGTLYRWLNKEAFKCFYNLMKLDVKNYMEGSVLEMHKQALEGIRASLDSSNEAVKLKASMWIIEKISQMQIGVTDIRQALKAQANNDYLNWMDGIDELAYKRALKEAGLEE